MNLQASSHDLFLSCVSGEFHGTPGDGFESYRTHLAAVLGEAGFHVAYQEAFAVSGGGLLEKLEKAVAGCKAVVHLVGDRTGSPPKPDEVEGLWIRHPDFLEKRPELRQAVGDGKGISYTLTSSPQGSCRGAAKKRTTGE